MSEGRTSRLISAIRFPQPPRQVHAQAARRRDDADVVLHGHGEVAHHVRARRAQVDDVVGRQDRAVDAHALTSPALGQRVCHPLDLVVLQIMARHAGLLGGVVDAGLAEGLFRRVQEHRAVGHEGLTARCLDHLGERQHRLRIGGGWIRVRAVDGGLQEHGLTRFDERQAAGQLDRTPDALAVAREVSAANHRNAALLRGSRPLGQTVGQAESRVRGRGGGTRATWPRSGCAQGQRGGSEH